MPDVLLLEPCNFIDFPVGGQLSFAKHMMRAFGNRLALVGISSDGTPVGQWIKKKLDGVLFDYYAYAKRDVSHKRPLIPARWSSYCDLKQHQNQILSSGINNVFLQSHEMLSLVLNWKCNSICFRFPGIENPLTISRYPWAKFLSGAFDRWFLPKVARADVVLAAADQRAITELGKRNSGCLLQKKIRQFPTRVDTDTYYPGDKKAHRKKLDMPQDGIIIVTTGRLHWAKGWKLLLDSFRQYMMSNANSMLYFVGDGEDRPKIEKAIETMNLSNKVVMVGRVPPNLVADYLRASDLFILGSEKEGWCTSLVEALATGMPIVSTNVSSANTIIKDGINGYIVRSRDPEEVSIAMIKALLLNSSHIKQYSAIETEKYAVKNLASDLMKVWPAIRE